MRRRWSHRLRVLTIPIASGLLGSLGTLAQPAPLKVRDVCEVLRAFDTYDGRLVAVRGVIRPSFEGGGLFGVRCSGKLTIDGSVWPWGVDIVWPSSSGATVVDETTRKAMATMSEVWRKNMNKNLKEKETELLVTLVGRFETSRSNVYVNSQGQKRMVGFGHLSVFSSRIIVSSIPEARIVDK